MTGLSPSREPELHGLWRELMEELHAPTEIAGRLFDRLRADYSRPERYYHNLTHIYHVVTIAREIASDLGMENADAVLLAGWFHDVVYNPRAGDNEAKSARYAEKALRELKLAGMSAEVSRLILATKTHEAAPDDLDTQMLHDADLAILGAHPDDYNDYASAIRKEYAWAPDEKYRAGRTQVLQSFLDRETIYFTRPMIDSHEAPARRNIARELQSLSALGDVL